MVRHEDLAEQAENNRTAIVPVVPNRGLILDRNGIVLASNYSAYTLEITPSKARDLDETIDELAEVIEIAPRDRRASSGCGRTRAASTPCRSAPA